MNSEFLEYFNIITAEKNASRRYTKPFFSQNRYNDREHNQNSLKSVLNYRMINREKLYALTDPIVNSDIGVV